MHVTISSKRHQARARNCGSFLHGASWGVMLPGSTSLNVFETRTWRAMVVLTTWMGLYHGDETMRVAPMALI